MILLTFAKGTRMTMIMNVSSCLTSKQGVNMGKRNYCAHAFRELRMRIKKAGLYGA